jgi:protoporphyrinogen/coproporphyrinogen III oxidase
MTFSPAQRGRQLIDKSGENIIQTYVNDINEIIPKFSDHIVESQVSRWSLGSAYVFPSRAKLRSTLKLIVGSLFLSWSF